MALDLDFSALACSPVKFLIFFIIAKFSEIRSILKSYVWFQGSVRKPLPRGKIVYLSLLYFQMLKSFYMPDYKFAHIWSPLYKILWQRRAAIRKEWTRKIFFLPKIINDFGGSDLLQAWPFWLLALRAVRWQALRVDHPLHTVARVMKASKPVTAALIATGHHPYLLKTSRKICSIISFGNPSH